MTEFNALATQLAIPVSRQTELGLFPSSWMERRVQSYVKRKAVIIQK
jgi:hypothetical protein